MNLEVNEIFAEIGRLHMQIAILQKQLVDLQAKQDIKDSPVEKE